MKRMRNRFYALTVLASGLLLAESCDVTGQIMNTIGLALGIANIWV